MATVGTCTSTVLMYKEDNMWGQGDISCTPPRTAHTAVLVAQPRLGMQTPHDLSSRTACPTEESPRHALDPCTHSPYLATNRAEGVALAATSGVTAAVGSVWQ